MPTLTSSRLILSVTIFIVLAGNYLFWTSFSQLIDLSSFKGWLTAAGFFMLLVWILGTLLLLVGMRYLVKPVLVLALIGSAILCYFQTDMRIIVNESIVQSLLETDAKEATEFLSINYFLYFIGLGVIPSLLVIVTPLKIMGFWRDWGYRLMTWLGLTAVTVLVVWAAYKDMALIGREHRELRMVLNPYFAISSTVRYFYDTATARPAVLTAIGEDARTLEPNKPKKTVVLFVLGETARLDHFSLGGYERETNPNLKNYSDLVFFKDTWSCGTATAESLPCIFSHLSQADFSVRKAWQYQTIIDVLTRVGVTGYWRDNNTGCKGICDRISSEDTGQLATAYPKFCVKDECYDEILLQGLTEKINAAKGDVFMVLHQKGSHGPAYYLRHPQEFTQFKPECEDNSPQNCEQEQIINAYDNTILYTDYVLKQAIDYLKQHEAEFNSVLFYVSDHGESLGENGIYLHGLPYLIAPDTQKRVPMLLWFSNGYKTAYTAKAQCAASKVNERLSHDTIFHTLLGLFAIDTQLYTKALDLTACSN